MTTFCRESSQSDQLASGNPKLPAGFCRAAVTVGSDSRALSTILNM